MIDPFSPPSTRTAPIPVPGTPPLLLMLIIDDEEIMRSFLSDVFKDCGYTVTIASNGEEALRKIEKEPFHIVITDVKMGRVSGIDVLQSIKKKNPETEVVVITGYASVDTATEAMKLGAFDYVTKPFEMDQIRQIVDKILEKRQWAKPA